MKSGEVKLFIGILVCALVLTGVAVFPSIISAINQPGPPKPYTMKVDRAALLGEGGHMKGNPSAPYTLIEFGDYQCSHCRDAEVEVNQVLNDHKDKLKVVFRHLALSPAHTHAPLLAQAAEAAARQGKFWEMHAAIFKSQDAYDMSSPEDVRKLVINLASQIKLDVPRFRKDLDDPKIERIVANQNKFITDLTIAVTPTFLLLPPTGDRAVKLSSRGAMLEHLAKPDALK